MATTASMPGRSHHSAPKFDGQPSSLKRFLNEVRDLAKEKGLTDGHAIRATISYAPSADYELWGSLPSAKGDVWDVFENELAALYPGSEGDRKYNRGHLDALVRQAAIMPVTDHLQLGEYYRSFLTISSFLKSKKRISDQECSAKFLEGLHYAFRAKLAEYLSIREPTHHVDDPWDMPVLYEAALFVLSNRNGGLGAPTPTLSTGFAAQNGRVKTEVFDASGLERYLESDVFINRMKSIWMPEPQHAQRGQYAPRGFDARVPVNGLATRPQAFNPQPAFNTRQNVTAPSSYNNNATPQLLPASRASAEQWEERPNTCIFCSDPQHYQTRCPQAADYLRRGLCIRDDRNQIVLPNGMYIGRRIGQGNNLKERIDAWHAQNPSGPGPTVASANFVDVSRTVAHTAATAPSNPWEVFTHSVHWEDEEEAIDDGLTQRERDEILILQNVAVTAQRKIKETRARASEQYGPTTRAKAYDTPPPAPSRNAARAPPPVREAPPHMKDAAPPRTQNSTPAPSAKEPAPAHISVEAAAPATYPQRTSRNPFVTNGAPQFSYHTPIESPETVSDVVQKHLDATITITNRQLLAVSPDVRRAVKDQIATKRTAIAPVVAVNELCASSDFYNAPEVQSGGGISVEAFLQSLVERTDDVVVANHLEDLRCITLQAPGVGPIEAIMDDGSQIIAMRADVWEKTGLPLRTDHQMIMESANQTTSDTKGLLQDFPVTIGDFKFYLQVQVVEKASYEMLLGRPFMTLCQASSRHFSNGDSHLTLVDPNTQAVITVATHKRKRVASSDPKPTPSANVNSFF